MSTGSDPGRTALLDLGLIGEEPFRVDANLIVTGRTCVLGSSGSGKSYAVGVICEELCKKRVPFALIDTEGEHSGLKEKFAMIWVGSGEECDLLWEGVNLEDLAGQAPDIAPLLLDVSETENPKEKVGTLISALYREISNRRTPYLLILEEADKFIPQSGQRLQIFDEVARRGRKRGLGLMLCSQRPSLVDKNVLSQCGNQLIGKLVIQNDLKAVAQFFPGRGLPTQLTRLKPGMFYAIGGISPNPVYLMLRKRETRHGGITPVLRERVVKPYMGSLSLTRTSGLGVLRGSQIAQTRPGLLPLIKVDDVPTFVKREKQFKLFGKEETVTSIQLFYRPLVELGVRLRTGVIKKKFETQYLIIDGERGKLIDGGDRLILREGFERVLGLRTFHLQVLREVSTDNDLSVIDIASKLGDSKGVVRRALNLLEEKKLVRSVEVRRVKLFRRLVDFPKVVWTDRELLLENVDIRGGKVGEVKVDEKEVREIVKGLWDGSNLDTFKVFLYPIYKVELTLKRKGREVLLDGRTGRDVVS